MKKLVVANLLVLAFLVGCGVTMVANTYVVPPANAQDTQRFDYTCADSSIKMDSNIAMLKQFGAQGWEVVTIEIGQFACFKRPM